MNGFVGILMPWLWWLYSACRGWDCWVAEGYFDSREDICFGQRSDSRPFHIMEALPPWQHGGPLDHSLIGGVQLVALVEAAVTRSLSRLAVMLSKRNRSGG